MNIIDISPEISENLSVWPGDTPYSREVTMDTDSGDHIGLSKITSTLHLGAHTDAPNHYAPDSPGISERSLNFYYGPAQVISASTKKGQRVLVSDLSTQTIHAPRVLIRTDSFATPNKWNEDFCALSVELVDFLAQQNVLLVGIDTPSIDPFNSKTLEAHAEVHRHNMAILEGVVLSDVIDGIYTISCLPLKIKGGDASPVRAVLIQ